MWLCLIKGAINIYGWTTDRIMLDSGSSYRGVQNQHFIISILYIKNSYIDFKKYKNNTGLVYKIAMG